MYVALAARGLSIKTNKKPSVMTLWSSVGSWELSYWIQFGISLGLNIVSQSNNSIKYITQAVFIFETILFCVATVSYWAKIVWHLSKQQERTNLLFAVCSLVILRNQVLALLRSITFLLSTTTIRPQRVSAAVVACNAVLSLKRELIFPSLFCGPVTGNLLPMSEFVRVQMHLCYGIDLIIILETLTLF